MRGFLRCLALSICAVALLPVAAAYADNGPHGGFTKVSDKCAACHRAHTAQGEMLLSRASEKDLCLGCHGATRQGSTTDVQDGLGVAGTPLLGGGFDYVTMNSTGSTTALPTSAPATSAHSIEGTGTAWGYGPVSASANAGLADVTMACTNCHDPHGGAGSNGQATYRILRTFPEGVPVGSGGPADVADPLVKTYVLNGSNADLGSYFGQHYSTVDSTSGLDRWSQLSKWCSRCHTRHLADAGSFTTSSGDAIYTYRHRTFTESKPASGCQNCHDVHGPTQYSGAVSCVACHVAHGTSAAMYGYATTVPYPDGQANQGSALLRMDGRGVCVGCHPNPQ